MTKVSILMSFFFITGGLTACGQSSSDGASGSNAIPVVDFAGTYSLNGDCNASSGTMSVSSKMIRLNDVVCKINKAAGLNSSSSEYKLTGCISDEGKLPYRTVTISEIEDGMVSVTGWGAREFAFQICG